MAAESGGMRADREVRQLDLSSLISQTERKSHTGSLGQWHSQVEHTRWSAEAEKKDPQAVCRKSKRTPVVLKRSIFMKKLSSVVVSPANSALLLTAVFVLWIFLHSVPSPFPFPLPPSLSSRLPSPPSPPPYDLL